MFGIQQFGRPGTPQQYYGYGGQYYYPAQSPDIFTSMMPMIMMIMMLAMVMPMMKGFATK